jgi:outer membrane protein
MKKRSLLIFGMILMVLGAVQSNAQKVAIVDISLVLQSIDDYKNAQQDLDNIASKWRQDIAQEQDIVKGMYNKYQAEQVLLSDDQKKKREEEIMVKEKTIREMQKDKFGAEGLLFKKRQELVKPVQERVYAVIEKYASDRGLDLILDKSSSSGIIFSAGVLDKTNDILNLLKK